MVIVRKFHHPTMLSCQQKMSEIPNREQTWQLPRIAMEIDSAALRIRKSIAKTRMHELPKLDCAGQFAKPPKRVKLLAAQHVSGHAKLEVLEAHIRMRF